MADVIDYKIYGHDMQLVEIELDPGEGVMAEAGAMSYMEQDLEMQTGTGGGLFGGFKRMITGESFFITTFKNNGKIKRSVGFSAPYPGQIIPIDLDKFNGEFICQKDSFLCAANGIDIDVAFTKKLGAGFFGGEGFILQRLKGDGIAFVHAGGSIIEKNLAAGEVLRVDTGCIVGFERSVDYNIKFVGGFKNALFGKEGLFLATLKGPGRVYIQSMPISKLAERLYANAGSTKERSGTGGSLLGGAVAGGILGGILDRD
ncbi:TIGR00266 family protein [uncultured Ilyobacter sp.]|uniref:TIGR00266 family protein n=1 Tax=uncultured Ilyobacter sp. TaxID=544433 RepID=UPI0037498B5D